MGLHSLSSMKSTQRKMRMLGFRIDGTVTGVKEATTIAAVPDVASSLNSTFFTFKTGLNAVSYYVWLNVATAGVDPAPGGTGIEVAVAADASANTIGAALRAAITSAVAGVTVTGSNENCIITNTVDGATTDAADGSAPTGFTITVDTQGVTSTTSILEGTFDGTLSEGAGAGDYTITFAQAFARAPIIQIGVLTAQTMYQVVSVSTTAVRVAMFDAADGTTAKDADFHLIAMGDMDADAR